MLWSNHCYSLFCSSWKVRDLSRTANPVGSWAILAVNNATAGCMYKSRVKSHCSQRIDRRFKRFVQSCHVTMVFLLAWLRSEHKFIPVASAVTLFMNSTSNRPVEWHTRDIRRSLEFFVKSLQLTFRMCMTSLIDRPGRAWKSHKQSSTLLSRSHFYVLF